MKRFISAVLIFSFTLLLCNFYSSASDMEDDFTSSDINIGAETDDVDVEGLSVNAKSAILIEALTGEILYSNNANEALAPASVTKIMTLLLVAEAIEDGKIDLADSVVVSANASSMGGSQVFLSEGESFTVEELLKCTVIASANDAAVALAELIAGTESRFVVLMNERAKALGMKSTNFENCTGLDDETTNHVTSAYDIALMSRELIKHDIILKYSNVWQDEIRNGDFVLTNTNRLVRYYQGCTGLKTGSTDKAGFCLSATAEREGMHLIAVVMGSPTRDDRNNAARALLDYGFSSHALYTDESIQLERVPVYHGTPDEVTLFTKDFYCLVKKGEGALVERKYNIPEYIKGYHSAGEKVGEVIYTLEGRELGRCDIIIYDDILPLSAWDIFLRILFGALN